MPCVGLCFRRNVFSKFVRQISAVTTAKKHKRSVKAGVIRLYAKHANVTRISQNLFFTF